MLPKYLRRASAVVLPLLVLLIGFAREGYGQFSSGSTGADGPLNLTTPGTIIFDPVALGLHPAVENVFNFTTINIGANVTVKLTSKALTGPVYWLAQGAVTITGVVDLNGENGHPFTSNVSDRVPAAGGAGGYSGGVGASAAMSATPGNGPGGGAVDIAGTFTGSQYLIPLIGGSGGGGTSGLGCSSTFGAGGGGGGGALLIASSVSITLTTPSGRIIATGGAGNNGGGPACGTIPRGGSGGAVRLISNTITLTSSGAAIDTRGGPVGGGDGIVRVEAFTTSFVVPGIVLGRLITSTPFMVVAPTAPPSAIKVTSISGIMINANPFSFPDAVINASGPVTVNVQAQYIPTELYPRLS